MLVLVALMAVFAIAMAVPAAQFLGGFGNPYGGGLGNYGSYGNYYPGGNQYYGGGFPGSMKNTLLDFFC